MAIRRYVVAEDGPRSVVEEPGTVLGELVFLGITEAIDTGNDVALGRILRIAARSLPQAERSAIAARLLDREELS